MQLQRVFREVFFKWKIFGNGDFGINSPSNSKSSSATRRALALECACSKTLSAHSTRTSINLNSWDWDCSPRKNAKVGLHSSLLNSDTTEALEFTTGLAEKVNKPATQDAYVYALVEVASLKLVLGQGDAVRKDLDAANKILDTFDSIDTVIHAAFYRVSADFYSVCPPYFS
jgi:hypothetical protein